MIYDLNNKLNQAYFQGLSSGLTQAHLNLLKENRHCSRINCPMQRKENDNNFDDSKCKKTCQWYTPVFTIDDTINLLENLLTFAKNKKQQENGDD